MENQIILATRQSTEAGYFSVWLFGKRVPGSYNPFECLKNFRKDDPYNNERLDDLDIPVLLQPLIQWSEE